MHAVILSGSGEATSDRARTLAAELLCESSGPRPCRACRHCRKVFQGPFPGLHPDVTVVERQPNSSGKLRREIVVDQIRALSVDALVLPNEAERKVYIFPEAETMNPQAQNAFLKLLEEPPARVSFLLCVRNPGALLETVRSRCASERAGGEAETASDQSEKRAEGWLAARRDRLALLRCCLAMEKLDNAQLLETVGCIRRRAVDAAGPEELLYLEEFLARAEKYLLANVGVKHVTGYLSTYVFGK